MKRRFTTLMTTLLLSVMFAVSASAYDVEVDGIYYNLLKKAKQAEVVGASKKLKNVIIPDVITYEDTEFKVVSLGYLALVGLDNVETIKLGNNIEEIGAGVFQYLKIKSINIPHSVKKIDVSAFDYCETLESVYIEDLTSWCNINFLNAKSNPMCSATKLYCNNELVKNLSIPDDVTKIGNYAFANATCIESVNISDNVTEIGNNAFYCCSNLTDVNFSSNLETIGESAFSDCTNIQSIEIPDKVNTIELYAFYGCEKLESVKMPQNLEVLKRGSFARCASLKSISITGPIKEIGEQAFYYCTSLTTVSIPNTITTLGSFCFQDCKELTKFICYAETTPNLGGYGYPFKDAYIEYATLYVPRKSIDLYKGHGVWNKFGNILAIEDLESGIKPIKDRDIAIQSIGGFITLSGLAPNEQVIFYATDGKELGTVKAIDGTAQFAAQSGTIVVAKIGKESVKIAIK